MKDVGEEGPCLHITLGLPGSPSVRSMGTRTMAHGPEQPQLGCEKPG